MKKEILIIQFQNKKINLLKNIAQCYATKENGNYNDYYSEIYLSAAKYGCFVSRGKKYWYNVETTEIRTIDKITDTIIYLNPAVKFRISKKQIEFAKNREKRISNIVQEIFEQSF